MDDIFRYINIYMYTVVLIRLHTLEEFMLFFLFCPFFRMMIIQKRYFHSRSVVGLNHLSTAVFSLFKS